MTGAEPTTDAAALAAIHAQSFATSWNEAAIRDLLTSPGCFAQWFPGRAFILVRAVLEDAEIITLATAPSARRKGLARLLLANAAEHCVLRGVETLHLEVGASNAAACHLYFGQGFQQVGRRQRYYDDGEDALLLRLNLCAGPAGQVPG